MFEFFKRSRQLKSSAPVQATDRLQEVVKHLRVMGYDLTPYGMAVAMASVSSDYNEVEVASHIAHVTLARDVREAGADIQKLTGYVPHGMALLEVLKEYKDAGSMQPALWENDARAIVGIITVDEQQEAWLSRVLSDPVAAEDRLARSRIRTPA